MRCQVFAHTYDVAAELVRDTSARASAAIAARGRFTLALTGGSAAERLYPVLAQAPLAWERVHVLFGDERCVPHDHADSNFRAAERALLARVSIPASQVHRIHGELPPDDAAAVYERTLRSFDDGVLDMVHLGMGPDGHVCSLFPDHALLREQHKLVAALTDSPKPPSSRVTLTLPALLRARAAQFLVFGENKAAAASAAVEDAQSSLPAAMVFRGNPNATWLLDVDAAGLLKR